MMLKRSFDICISFLFVCTLFPLLYIFIGIAIKCTSKGPVLFEQRRSGLNDKTFICLKFRTMVVNDEADTRQATEDDRRITCIGHFLRRTSLDELPQFINVLKGDMSIVGPRPHMLCQTRVYASRIPGYMKRLSVRPGITGLAQILGYRGEIRTDADMVHRLRLDLWYIDHWTLQLDIYIFFRTLFHLVADACMIVK